MVDLTFLNVHHKRNYQDRVEVDLVDLMDVCSLTLYGNIYQICVMCSFIVYRGKGPPRPPVHLAETAHVSDQMGFRDPRPDTSALVGALDYHRWGWSVIPVVAGTKESLKRCRWMRFQKHQSVKGREANRE